MEIVTVIPFAKSSFNRELTYFSKEKIKIGSIISVSIRNKETLALVIDTQNINELKSEIKNMDFNLKKINEIKDKSLFEKEFLNSVLKTSEELFVKKSILLPKLIPSVVKENYAEFEKEYLELKNKDKKNNKNQKYLFQDTFEKRIEYYNNLISKTFLKKKSILIVLPTISNIDIFEKIFSKNFNKTIVLHSKLSNKKLKENIKKILSLKEESFLILTTPLFLSIPINNLETIILENENNNAYYTLEKNSFDTRVFIENFAFTKKTNLILADNLLRFETIAREKIDKIKVINKINFKFNLKEKILISNRDKENPQKNKFSIFSKENIEKIKNNLENKENIFVFSLKKGIASTTICRNCNTEVLCISCDKPLILQYKNEKKETIFKCKNCKIEKETDIKCKNCDSYDLKSLGININTVANELKNTFLKYKIFEVDKSIAKNDTNLKKIIEEFENTKGSMLVGTEIVFPYINKKIPFSIIASIDSLLSIPNFKISERILQIILKIKNITENKLIIETKDKDNFLFNAIKENKIKELVENELKIRENLGYPPYKKHIKIRIFCKKEELQKNREFLLKYFKDFNPLVYKGYLEKIKEKYIINALIKIDIKDKRNIVLSNKLKSLPQEFIIQINPENIL